MALRIDRTNYYYTMVPDRPGEAYRLLSHLATEQVNLLAFNAIPMGVNTQLVLFPEDDDALMHTASISPVPMPRSSCGETTSWGPWPRSTAPWPTPA
jgi:hypothetical protein